MEETLRVSILLHVSSLVILGVLWLSSLILYAWEHARQTKHILLCKIAECQADMISVHSLSFLTSLIECSAAFYVNTQSFVVVHILQLSSRCYSQMIASSRAGLRATTCRTPPLIDLIASNKAKYSDDLWTN